MINDLDAIEAEILAADAAKQDAANREEQELVIIRAERQANWPPPEKILQWYIQQHQEGRFDYAALVEKAESVGFTEEDLQIELAKQPQQSIQTATSIRLTDLVLSYVTMAPNTRECYDKDWNVETSFYPKTEHSGIRIKHARTLCGNYKLLVFDYDKKTDPNGTGLARFLEKYPILKNTYMVQTRTGGVHIYVLVPIDVFISKNQKHWPKAEYAIDFLRNGLVPCAGTKTALGEYKVLDNTDVVILPAEIINEFDQTTENNGDGIDVPIVSLSEYPKWLSYVQNCPPDGAHKVICQACNWGMPEDVVFEDMRKYHTPRCVTPLSDKDLLKKIKNTYKSLIAKGRCGNETAEAGFIDCVPDVVATKGKQTSNNEDSHADDTNDLNKSGQTQAKSNAAIAVLVEIATAKTELWRSRKIGYATININGHNEHHRIKSETFEALLKTWYFDRTGKIPDEKHVKNAISYFDGRACIKGKHYDTALRVAKHQGKIYYDLCDDDWRALEIDPELPSPHWCVIDNPPVKFIRDANMLPLPLPEAAKPEVFDELFTILNFADEESRIMFLCFLVCCLGVLSAYPVLVLSAGEGMLKTFLLRVARKLTDPNAEPDRIEPENVEDLMTAALYNRVPSWDNVSDVPVWMSNALCRLTYGANHSTRKHYEQGVEFTMSALRPAILAGIGTLAVRHDLLQRTFRPRLKRVPYMDDEEAAAKFNAIYPRLLGALFTAVAGAIKQLPDVRLGGNPPRMAGAYKWCLAAASDLGYTEENIRQAFDSQRAEAAGISIESSPMTEYIDSKLHKPWTGTAEELLNTAQIAMRHTKGLPLSARGVSDLLMKQQEALKQIGILVTWLPRQAKRKLIRIEETAARQASSQPAQSIEKCDPWVEFLLPCVNTNPFGFTAAEAFQALELKKYQVTPQHDERLDAVLKAMGCILSHGFWMNAKSVEKHLKPS